MNIEKKKCFNRRGSTTEMFQAQIFRTNIEQRNNTRCMKTVIPFFFNLITLVISCMLTERLYVVTVRIGPWIIFKNLL